MNTCIYIDTRPEAPSFFAPPPDVRDYADWLMLQYKTSQQQQKGLPHNQGLIQWINKVLYQVKYHQCEVLAIGPYAGLAAKWLEEITDNSVFVAVLMTAERIKENEIPNP